MEIKMHLSERKALRVMWPIVIDALLCATCSGLYGFVFGGIGKGIHTEPLQLVWTAGYFALCGGIVGAFAGAFAGARNGILAPVEKPFESTESARQQTQEKRSQIEATRFQSVPAPHQPQSSLSQNNLAATSN
ncbi:MAG: hypothetical protein JWM11_5828 [Planctomycetaceae bacterium]|nr:hypothetical protein [Planctomycetaceae bacterium]